VKVVDTIDAKERGCQLSLPDHAGTEDCCGRFSKPAIALTGPPTDAVAGPIEDAPWS